jgi:hypothetical protein
LQLVSRTVGIDRVVDEFIFKFTHDRQMDWMYAAPPFPGIPSFSFLTSLRFLFSHSLVSFFFGID